MGSKAAKSYGSDAEPTAGSVQVTRTSALAVRQVHARRVTLGTPSTIERTVRMNRQVASERNSQLVVQVCRSSGISTRMMVSHSP